VKFLVTEVIDFSSNTTNSFIYQVRFLYLILFYDRVKLETSTEVRFLYLILFYDRVKLETSTE